jgi:hypothetical protein
MTTKRREHSDSARPPAPYSAEVLAQIAPPRQPAVVVFAGPGGFDLAEVRRKHHGRGSALVVPEGEQPETFTWPPVEPDAVCVNDPRPAVRADLEMRVRALCARTEQFP